MRKKRTHHLYPDLQTCSFPPLKPACSKYTGILLAGLLLSGCGDTSPTPTPTPPPTPTPTTSGVVISEAVASNADFEDEDGETSDWFELHNPTDTPINIGGWTVSDKDDEPDMWSFPEITLKPGQYLLVWASDKDRTGTSLHTNFKLSTDGETLYLFDSSGASVDSLEITGAPAGISIGRNEQNEVRYYNVLTPGAKNSATSYAGVITSAPEFSNPGGENSEGTVEISGAGADEIIRYTLDATIPDSSAPVYEGPLVINENTVVRARIFRDDHLPSITASRTFLTGEKHELPVMTLITEPANFFDENTGIYVFGPKDYWQEEPFYGSNFWEDWEREIQFSFYEPDGTLGISTDAGVKIFGGWSRAHPQKSLSLFARGKYGNKEFEYNFFPDRPYDEFQSLVLRNSGNDWMTTMIHDAVLTSLMEDTNIDYQAYRPVATYLNGEYWGLYNLREKVSEHFLASRHGIDADSINLLESNGAVIEGSNAEYEALIKFVSTSDLSSSENYAKVTEQIDIDNYITYQVAQIYFGNKDWPGNNIKFWNSPETKWRWILFDTDISFGIFEEEDYLLDSLSAAAAPDGPVWPNPPWSTLLFRNLLKNETFAIQFINTFADSLNSRFRPQNVVDRIELYANGISSEVEHQIARWLPEMEFDPEEEEIDPEEAWIYNLSVMVTFAEERPTHIKAHLSNYFSLGEAVTLNIQTNDAALGQITVNTLTITDSNWNGDYFPGVPVTVTAHPAEGYAFSHWEGDLEATTPEVVIDPAEVTALKAVFVPAE